MLTNSEWRAVGRRVPFLCSPVVGILKMGGGTNLKFVSVYWSMEEEGSINNIAQA